MLTFHFYRWNQLKVIPLDSRVPTMNDVRPNRSESVSASAADIDVELLIHSRCGAT